jgi:hypothetical protein
MKWAPASLIALLVLLSLSAPASHEPHGQFGGTFIGAIVAADGVVIGADSRSTFVDAAGKRIGYVDRMQKVYVDHGAAVAVAGLTSVEDDLFSSFIQRNDYLLRRPVNEILFDVALKLPFKNSTNVLLLSAGYLNGEANICAKSPNDPQNCRKTGYIANKTSPGLRRWIEARNGRMPSSVEAAAALEQAIMESADVDPSVGGPISLVLVPKSGTPRWLKNPPENNGWARVCDVVASYRRGQTLISFINTKDELDKYLNAACPK